MLTKQTQPANCTWDIGCRDSDIWTRTLHMIDKSMSVACRTSHNAQPIKRMYLCAHIIIIIENQFCCRSSPSSTSLSSSCHSVSRVPAFRISLFLRYLPISFVDKSMAYQHQNADEKPFTMNQHEMDVDERRTM